VNDMNDSDGAGSHDMVLRVSGDIVDRLMNAIDPDAVVRVDSWQAICTDAAAEIRRLRAKVAELQPDEST